MNIAAGFGFDLLVTLHRVFYLSSKRSPFGFIGPRKIPSGNFFFIDFDPQPLDVMEKIIGIMNDSYPDGDF